jgi:hypothetical protein
MVEKTPNIKLPSFISAFIITHHTFRKYFFGRYKKNSKHNLHRNTHRRRPASFCGRRFCVHCVQGLAVVDKSTLAMATTASTAAAAAAASAASSTSVGRARQVCPTTLVVCLLCPLLLTGLLVGSGHAVMHWIIKDGVIVPQVCVLRLDGCVACV